MYFPGKEPKHIWLVGGFTKDVKPSKITRHICIDKATLSQLLEEVRKQLKSHVASKNPDGTVDTVFIVFAVGLFDLITDATAVSLLKNLNELVSRERQLREELAFYENVVSNICFASVYPPSMEALGAGVYSKHAQQFVDLVFRWYNRWTLILNNFNGSGICRMDKPFHCAKGVYKLKTTQLEADGIMPTASTAKLLESFVDKFVLRLQELWAKKESFPAETFDQVVLKKSWTSVLEAEKVYLDAFSGAAQSFKVVNMPFFSAHFEESVPVDESNRPKVDEVKSSPEQAKSSSDFAIPIRSVSTKHNEKKASSETVDVCTDLSERLPKEDDHSLPNASVVSGDSSNSTSSKRAYRVLIGDSDDLRTSDADEQYLNLYHVAQKIVAQCSVHIQSKALNLLNTFKQEELEVHERRVAEDRERVANFQKKINGMKNLTMASSPSTVSKQSKIGQQKEGWSNQNTSQQSSLSDVVSEIEHQIGESQKIFSQNFIGNGEIEQKDMGYHKNSQQQSLANVSSIDQQKKAEQPSLSQVVSDVELQCIANSNVPYCGSLNQSQQLRYQNPNSNLQNQHNQLKYQNQFAYPPPQISGNILPTGTQSLQHRQMAVQKSHQKGIQMPQHHPAKQNYNSQPYFNSSSFQEGKQVPQSQKEQPYFMSQPPSIIGSNLSQEDKQMSQYYPAPQTFKPQPRFTAPIPQDSFQKDKQGLHHRSQQQFSKPHSSVARPQRSQPYDVPQPNIGQRPLYVSIKKVPQNSQQI